MYRDGSKGMNDGRSIKVSHNGAESLSCNCGQLALPEKEPSEVWSGALSGAKPYSNGMPATDISRESSLVCIPQCLV